MLMLFNFLNKNLVSYQIILLVVYLIAITITERMTVVLPVYILFSAIPFISNFKIKGIIPFVYVYYTGIYFVLGVVFQETIPALVSFFSRLYQFIVIIVVINHKIIDSLYLNIKKILFWALATETFLGIYLFFTSSMESSSGLVRLVAGNQPVGGNLTIAILPLIILVYFNNKLIRGYVISCSLFLFAWIVLSGTRGYLILFLAAMLPVYYSYFILECHNKRKVLLNYLLVVSLVSAFTIFIIDNFGMIDYFLNIARVNESLGIRGLEDKIAADYWLRTSIFNQMFGMGLGGIAAEQQGYISSVFGVMGNSWAYTIYANRIGTSFHNLYGNILIMQGLFGILLVIGIFIWGIRKIYKFNIANRLEKMAYLLYWVSFFIMNIFRWSSECGISEMLFLGIALILSCRYAKRKSQVI